MAYNITVAEDDRLVTATIERGQEAILVTFDDSDGTVFDRLCCILKAIGVEKLICLATQTPDSKFGFVLDPNKRVFTKHL